MFDYKASHAVSNKNCRMLSAVTPSKHDFPPKRAKYRNVLQIW